MSEKQAKLNTVWAELIIEELVRCGVDYFCISPGSRSTPLVAAVAHNKLAHHFIHYDERGTAFCALGYARAAGTPAAVITTSGTAAANLYPAVCEAAIDNIPLILLTADRPPELIDNGSNQTMQQNGMFGRYVRWQFDLPTPTREISPSTVLTTVDQAVYRSRYVEAGPVHLNCRYREPLEPQAGGIAEEYASCLAQWTQDSRPYTVYASPCQAVDCKTVERITRIIESAERGLLVVGRLDSNGQRGAVLRLMDRLKWPVYADIMSGLRVAHGGINIIRYFDQQLLSNDFNRRMRPSTVLHVGGRTISKRLGEFLNVNRPEHYVVVKTSSDRYDPIHAVTLHVQADISTACDALRPTSSRLDVSYAESYPACAAEVERIIGTGIDENGLSEPFIARCVSEEMPEGTGLFISSSMPIRDVDLYGPSGRTNITVAANRGISGIDGVISSALGFAAASGRATTLLIGDLAFIHDVNALSALHRTGLPLVIVVINNMGGGIFDFLPISRHQDVFEEFFATPHDFSFGGVCETFGIPYHLCSEKDGFRQTCRKAMRSGQPCVIEVRTDRADNLRLRRTMKMQIIEMLNASVGIGK